MYSWQCSSRSLWVAIIVGTALLGLAVVTGLVSNGFRATDLAGSASPTPEDTEPPTSEADEDGPFSRYTVLTDAGETFSLAQGEYLVAMLSMSCEHCMASVAQLNEYVGLLPEIPVVALCWEPSEGAMAEFVSMSDPLFPMHSLGDNFMEFAELIGSAPPRLSFVRDGFAVQSWDDTMPDLETLLAAVASSPGF